MSRFRAQGLILIVMFLGCRGLGYRDQNLGVLGFRVYSGYVQIV